MNADHPALRIGVDAQPLFRDRRSAGRWLGVALARIVRTNDAIVLATSSDGLAVAAEVARRLRTTLALLEPAAEAALRPAVRLTDACVVLVDDVLDGDGDGRLEAAVPFVRARAPGRLIAAVPVAERRAAERLQPAVDAFVCLAVPEPFVERGVWYAERPSPAPRV